MEMCKNNLKSHIFGQPECIPGKTEQRAEQIASLWVMQITDALAYIHREGVVHRDLKLENILVVESRTVRV